MFSIRSILFAAVAFATVATAIPTPDTTSNGLTAALAPLAGGLTHGNIVPGANAVGAPTKRGASQSPKDCFKKCRDTVDPIIVKIS